MPERNKQTSGLSRQQIFQNIQSIKGTATLGGRRGAPYFCGQGKGIFCCIGRFMSLKSELQFCLCYETTANRVCKKSEISNGIKSIFSSTVLLTFGKSASVILSVQVEKFIKKRKRSLQSQTDPTNYFFQWWPIFYNHGHVRFDMLFIQYLKFQQLGQDRSCVVAKGSHRIDVEVQPNLTLAKLWQCAMWIIQWQQITTKMSK